MSLAREDEGGYRWCSTVGAVGYVEGPLIIRAGAAEKLWFFLSTSAMKKQNMQTIDHSVQK
jgi:hypothetical protein